MSSTDCAIWLITVTIFRRLRNVLILEQLHRFLSSETPLTSARLDCACVTRSFCVVRRVVPTPRRDPRAAQIAVELREREPFRTACR